MAAKRNGHQSSSQAKYWIWERKINQSINQSGKRHSRVNHPTKFPVKRKIINCSVRQPDENFHQSIHRENIRVVFMRQWRERPLGCAWQRRRSNSEDKDESTSQIRCLLVLLIMQKRTINPPRKHQRCVDLTITERLSNNPSDTHRSHKEEEKPSIYLSVGCTSALHNRVKYFSRNGKTILVKTDCSFWFRCLHSFVLLVVFLFLILKKIHYSAQVHLTRLKRGGTNRLIFVGPPWISLSFLNP